LVDAKGVSFASSATTFLRHVDGVLHVGGATSGSDRASATFVVS